MDISWSELVLDKGIDITGILVGVLIIAWQIRSGFSLQRENKKLELYLQIYNDIFEKIRLAKLSLQNLSGLSLVHMSHLESKIAGIKLDRFTPASMQHIFNQTELDINEIIHIIDKYESLLDEINHLKDQIEQKKASYNGFFMYYFKTVMPFLPASLSKDEDAKILKEPDKDVLIAIKESRDNYWEAERVLLKEINELAISAQNYLLGPLKK